MDISIESIVAQAYQIGSQPDHYINVNESLIALQKTLSQQFNISGDQAFMIVTNSFEDGRQQSYRHIQVTIR